MAVGTPKVWVTQAPAHLADLAWDDAWDGEAQHASGIAPCHP